tara:strand:- start:46 stop:891 length:846 start_codon:yes stop_codon:yes gene_type:complete
MTVSFFLVSNMNDRFNTPWRRMSTAIYTAPSDGKVFGTMEVDITAAERYIQEQRTKGSHITITHVVVAAIARAVALDAPEINGFVRRGNVIPRDYVDVSVAVNIKTGLEMAYMVVRNADRKTVHEIGEEIRTKSAAQRQRERGKTMSSKNLLASIPWPFRRLLFRLIRWIVNELGIELKSFGLADRTFGSVLVTNIGSHGLTTAYPALFPAAKLPAVVAMGKIEEKPVVRDGEIVIRSILPLSGTFDHRIVDGNQVSKVARGIIARLALPDELETAPSDLI